MDEQSLASKLIAYDSSSAPGIRRCAAFVSSWLEANEVTVKEIRVRDLPVVVAEVGSGPRTVVFHGHLDVVPAAPSQFHPRIDGDRLYGRGAYDMKGALGAMMLAMCDLRGLEGTRVRLAVVPDEESEEDDDRASDVIVDQGWHGDFAITGEPTDLHVGVQAKGVLALHLEVRGTAAHGSTPWLGENAILKAFDVYRGIESLPFSLESSELFARPSINLGRIRGGDVLNQVPDACRIDVDIRYLPTQDPDEVLRQVTTLPDIRVVSTFCRPPAEVDPEDPYVETLRRTVARHTDGATTSVGRDGASDAVSFLEAGVPAVEFGPVGDGHHGPEEWVSVDSLRTYRRALSEFVRNLGDGTGSDV